MAAAAAPMPAVIEVEHLGKTYMTGDTAFAALTDVSFAIRRGDFVAIMGPSGSGKSTLMNLVGCLDQPSAGVVRVNGVDITSLSSNQLADVRRKTIGFVFQTFQLLPRLSALENVAMPLTYAGIGAFARRKRANALIEAVGLAGRAQHPPPKLSGGQKQRVAIARALVNDPTIVLADEPTGALDSRTGREIMALLQRLNAEGRTIVLVTHDDQIARHAHRILRFSDGRLIADETVATPLDAAAGLAAAPIPEAAP